MPQEIERKFLVINVNWRGLSTGVKYRQGYISTLSKKTVRVRVAGEKGFLTLKGITTGASRLEYEYEIPANEADEILDKLCDGSIVEKIRYKIDYAGLVWEVDEFYGENAGLILAEVELTDTAQTIDLPDWIGKEVTDDPRYYNAYLAQIPFSNW